MNKFKQTFITAFALFSLFFGAGNLILPPLLGFKAGVRWFIVMLGFCISAVLLPLLGILAHAKLQGTMLDFGKKVSAKFSLWYCFMVYAISVALPMPRTASVTHEMAFQPFFNFSSWTTSLIYFTLLFIVVINRPKILDIIGKILTPLILIIIITIIGVALFREHAPMVAPQSNTGLINGMLEGYQTFDAIGAVLAGGVLVMSLRLKGPTDYKTRKRILSKAGIIAGTGLFIMYTGLIVVGALYNGSFQESITRTQLLSGIASVTLGNTGYIFLGILVSLACFTTAVGIITGTADFFSMILGNSKKAYLTTAFISCVLGVILGRFDVYYIIVIAVPALLLIYPITIVMILLNILPESYTKPFVFRAVIYTTLLFSLPDFIAAIGYEAVVEPLRNVIPLGVHHLGWLLPVILVFIGSNLSLARSMH